MNAHDLIKEAIAEKGKFDSVYWIACGGSMIDLIPAHELLQREATTFTSYIYTAREFDIMRPRRLGEKSLVIACSHSGNTPEVVEGCEIALAAGATVILFTTVTSTIGTLQLFDESFNLTRGGPAYQSMTMSHYLYELSFQKNPNIGYGSALSYVILILVAVLALVQMKVGDKRD